MQTSSQIKLLDNYIFPGHHATPLQCYAWSLGRPGAAVEHVALVIVGGLLTRTIVGFMPGMASNRTWLLGQDRSRVRDKHHKVVEFATVQV